MTLTHWEQGSQPTMEMCLPMLPLCTSIITQIYLMRIRGMEGICLMMLKQKLTLTW